MLVTIALLGALVALIWMEYAQHDCINGKDCRWIPQSPEFTDAQPAELLAYVRALARCEREAASWRRALIVGIVAALATALLLTGRWPDEGKWIVAALLVAVGYYFSTAWLYTHFHEPNRRRLDETLDSLASRFYGPDSYGRF